MYQESVRKNRTSAFIFNLTTTHSKEITINDTSTYKDYLYNIVEVKQGYAIYITNISDSSTVRLILGKKSLHQGVFAAKSNTEHYKYLVFEEEYVL